MIGVRLPVLLRRLWWLVAALLAVHVVLALLNPSGFPGDEVLLRSFDPNEESSLATALAVAILALTALVAWTNARVAPHDARAWTGLALLFGAGAVDEIASLHESLTPPLRQLFGFEGLLYFAWIVPALLFLVVVGLVYARFLLRLPPRVRTLVVAGAAIFVLGGIGFEAVGGLVVDRFGNEGALYRVAYTFEEALEFIGATMLLQGFALFGRGRERGFVLGDDRGDAAPS